MNNFPKTFTICVKNSEQIRFVINNLLQIFPNLIIRDKKYFLNYFVNNENIPYLYIVKQQYELKFFKDLKHIWCEYEINFENFKQIIL